MEIQRNLFTQIVIPIKIKKWGLDFLLYAAFISLAITVGLRATASGPGISPDSVTYISMGENIVQGNGFVSNLSDTFDASAHSAITSWPPGYPLLIAGLVVLGLPASEAAKLVTILSLALLLVVVYWLAQSLSGRLVGLLCSAAVFALMPVLRAATFALSEMPFALFTTLAVASLVQYTRQASTRRWLWLVLSALSTALAVLTRYVGLIWVPAGLVVIGLGVLISSQRSIVLFLRRAALPMLIFALISLLPSIPVFIRNLALTGQITGLDRFAGYHPAFAENLRYALGTLLSDLVPSIHIGLRSLLGQSRLVIALALLVTLLLVGGTLVLWKRGFRDGRLAQSTRQPLFRAPQDFLSWLIPVIYVASYLAGVILLASIQLFPAYDWPRILVVTYPLILITLLAFWSRFIQSFLHAAHSPVRALATALPALLLIVPYAVQTAGFVPFASQGQEMSTRDWRENQGIQFLLKTVSTQDEIFSDRPDAVCYVMDRTVRYLAYRSQYNQFAALVNKPKPGGFYIIVFKGALGQPDPFFAPRLSAGDIARLAAAHTNVQRIADFSDSTVYRVH